MKLGISIPLNFNASFEFENKIKSFISNDDELQIQIPDLSDLVFEIKKIVKEYEVDIQIIQNNWLIHKEKSGIIRNIKLVEDIDYLLVYNDDNCNRTKHLLKLAKEKRIQTEIISIKTSDYEITSNETEGKSFESLLEQLDSIHIEKQNAIDNGSYELAAFIRDKERKLRLHLEAKSEYY